MQERGLRSFAREEVHVEREIFCDEGGNKPASHADDDGTEEDDDELRGDGPEIDDAGVGVRVEERQHGLKNHDGNCVIDNCLARGDGRRCCIDLHNLEYGKCGEGVDL